MISPAQPHTHGSHQTSPASALVTQQVGSMATRSLVDSGPRPRSHALAIKTDPSSRGPQIGRKRSNYEMPRRPPLLSALRERLQLGPECRLKSSRTRDVLLWPVDRATRTAVECRRCEHHRERKGKRTNGRMEWRILHVIAWELSLASRCQEEGGCEAMRAAPMQRSRSDPAVNKARN
jgi:hypothetical protein